jgi:hypothetical protein
VDEGIEGGIIVKMQVQEVISYLLMPETFLLFRFKGRDALHFCILSSGAVES